MSLRPRYSLLALLLFTALVAGGIKLWRGPHRVQFANAETEAWKNDQLTRKLWHESQLFQLPLAMQGTYVQQECEYLQGPQGKHVLTVSETWEIPRYLVLIEKPGHALIPEIRRSATTLTPESVMALVQRADYRVVSVQHIICWVAEDLTHYPWGVLYSTDLAISVAIPVDQWHPCYFLTAEGQVYQLRTLPRESSSRNETEHTLQPVEWSSVKNAAISARLQEYWQTFEQL